MFEHPGTRSRHLGGASMTKMIPLTQGKFALVDDEDFEYISKFKWAFNSVGYAVRSEPRPSKRVILMHRVISNAADKMEVDHRNGNRLDNRRSNLRECSKSQNQQNVQLKANNTTGYKGVSTVKKTKKFRAHITVNQKQIHLGTFEKAEDAARAYNKAAKQYFREFARLNEGI